MSALLDFGASAHFAVTGVCRAVWVKDKGSVWTKQAACSIPKITKSEKKRTATPKFKDMPSNNRLILDSRSIPV